MDLFFYGTLLDNEIFEQISGLTRSQIETQDAWREGVRCTGISGQAYPMLVEHAGERTPGRIFKNIEGDALERIRFYEGFEYDIIRIQVVTDEGPRMVHVFEGSDRPFSNGLPWSLETWCKDYKAITLRIAAVMMPKFGKLNFEDFNAEWDALEAEWGLWG